MHESLRSYKRIHGGVPLPLAAIGESVRGRESPHADDLRRLASAVGLPEPAVRGALSYYASLSAAPDAVQVCVGTSCMLAGAMQVKAGLEARGAAVHPVHCLGHCDRSPVARRRDEAVVCGAEAAAVEPILAEDAGASPAPCDVRAHASAAVVTARLGPAKRAGPAWSAAGAAYAGLRRAVELEPDAIVSALERSGLRGRGGAAFPTGTKWRLCAENPGAEKFIVANGDEGDPGSFIDRVLMELDPHAILEGMAIAARAVGAGRGIVFIRSEYPAALDAMRRAIEEATAAGFLGRSVLDSGAGFEVTAFSGAGSYVCGEETALLNAIEGFRGEVRLRPPYPTRAGLYGLPTVVDNVETLANVPFILRHGPDAYAAMGSRASSGTKAMCLNHGFRRPGIVEVEFGTTLRRVIEEFAGGAAGADPIEAVILGGPMGSVLWPPDWDVPICYAAMSQRGVRLGHGGLVALPAGTDWQALLEHWLTFMERESCGRCAPCALGSAEALRLARRPAAAARRELLELLETIACASLCAFGQQIPGPVRRILERRSTGGGP